MPTLRLGARVPTTCAEGPGLRYALWVQGCSLRCPGCCNPELLDPGGGEAIAVETLLDEIAAVRAVVEGISVLGGEPLDQAPALAALLANVRAMGLGVVVFSGHALEALRERRDPATDAVLAAVDLLVDGAYERDRPERRRPWVGSENQRFHHLTPRYLSAVEAAACDTVEVRLGPGGRVSINGWPESWSRSLRTAPDRTGQTGPAE